MVMKNRKFGKFDYKLASSHRLKSIAKKKGELLERTRCIAFRISKSKAGYNLYTRKKKWGLFIGWVESFNYLK